MPALICGVQHGRCGGDDAPARGVCASAEGAAGHALPYKSGEQPAHKNLTPKVCPSSLLFLSPKTHGLGLVSVSDLLVSVLDRGLIFPEFSVLLFTSWVALPLLAHCTIITVIIIADQFRGTFNRLFLFFCGVPSVEELCAVDLYNSSALSSHGQMEMILSACKQIHKAGFLNSILHSQVFT